MRDYFLGISGRDPMNDVDASNASRLNVVIILDQNVNVPHHQNEFQNVPPHQIISYQIFVSRVILIQ